MPLGQADPRAAQYGLQTPNIKDDLLNMLQGADPTFGWLSSKLPQPGQQDATLQMLMGAITPGIPFDQLGVIGKAMKTMPTRRLLKWLDEFNLPHSAPSPRIPAEIQEQVQAALEAAGIPKFEGITTGHAVEKMGIIELLKRALDNDAVAVSNLGTLFENTSTVQDMMNAINKHSSDLELYRFLLEPK